MLNFRPTHYHVTTLGKLFTHASLANQCGWFWALGSDAVRLTTSGIAPEWKGTNNHAKD